MLEARSISVALGGKQVLHDVDFDARPGHVTAIIGPNGSGKTTLLRALTGDVPFRGTVRLNGRDCATAAGWELAAIRAVLPQAATLAFPFTAIEVVRMGLLAGRSGGDAGLPQRALDRVGLGGFANRFYQELSGGEQQRVQLARILTQVWDPVAFGAPRWLILDEPVSSLDIGHQLQVMEILRDYAARGGGVVAVMHDLNLTAMFADHVAIMHEGRVLASGAPAVATTDDTLSRAYGCSIRINTTPPPGATFLLPHMASLA